MAEEDKLFPEILESLEVQVLFKIISLFIMNTWWCNCVIFYVIFLKNILQEQKKKEKLEKKKRSLKVVEVIITSQNVLLVLKIEPRVLNMWRGWPTTEGFSPLEYLCYLKFWDNYLCLFIIYLISNSIFYSIFFKKRFYFYFMCVCFAYVCVSTSCVWDAPGSPMWMSNLLELELFCLFICLL